MQDQPSMTDGSMAMDNAADMSMPHGDDPIKQGEHMKFLELVPESEASHVAVKSGSWFDASTWKGGKIPGDGAKVLIPDGISVAYSQESDARLKTVRLDGTLTFASDANTKLVVDTFVNTPSGTLNIGSEGNPVQADKATQIIITADGAIDRSWDPTLISRGVISHGTTNIYGAEKTDFTTLQSDVAAGNSELVLSKSPTGWQVGDQLVLGGTARNYNGSHEDNSKFQDEVLTITEISGNRVKFTNNDVGEGDNTVLRYDHTRPDVAEKGQLKLYVANTTRNVSFETEAADLPPGERGHVMFMHSPDVVVQNAGFYNLGRSDKTQLVDDIGTNKDGRDGTGGNVRGRYALHFHRTGADDLSGAPAVAKGNAVVGSPGWGIVHHDSHALVEDNVVFDVAGAGIVQEAGNEIGAWRNNLTIKTTGDGDGGLGFGFRDERPLNFDFGFNGEGFWVQGAGLVDFKDNIAISTAGEAVTFHGGLDGGDSVRDKKFVKVENLPDYLKDIAKNTDDQSVIDVGTVPTNFDGFTAYNAERGIGSWKRTINRDSLVSMDNFDSEGLTKPAHNYPSTYENFQLWNIRNTGVNFTYNGNVQLKNGLILGDGDRSTKYGASGITNNHAANRLSLDGVTIKNFEIGMKVPRDGTGNNGPAFTGSEVKNSTFDNNGVNFAPTRPLGPDDDGNSRGEEDLAAFFEVKNVSFKDVEGNRAPTARFNAKAVGGLAVEFSAGGSYDPDAGENSKGENLRDKAGKGVVAYGWDFDNDGTIDEFGRTVRKAFEREGDRDVTLTVWDTQGKPATTTQSVTVASATFGNAFQNSGFSETKVFSPAYKGNSAFANKGWFATDGATVNANMGNGGVAVLSGEKYRSGVGQAIYDQGTMTGTQTLSLNVKNTEGGLKPWQLNEVSVNLWGVDGEFGNQLYDYQGPREVGALPMESTKLLEQTLGGESFDWKTFKWDVDLGDGYDYLMVQVDAAKVGNGSNESGNFVAIDNVRFGGGTGKSTGSSEPLPEPSPEPEPTPDPVEDPATPSEEEPVDEQPVEETPVEEEPATEEEPPEEEPVAEQPAKEEPVDEEPLEEDIPSEEPVDEQDPMDESVGEEPAEEDIPEEEPTAEEEPTDEEPIEEDIPAEEPVAEQPVEEIPDEEPVAEEEPADEEPLEEEPAEEDIPAEEPVAEQPIDEELPDEDIDESVEEDAPADEPVAEQPMEEEPMDNEPIDEQPIEEDSLDEEHMAKDPAAEEPAVDDSADPMPDAEAPDAGSPDPVMDEADLSGSGGQNQFTVETGDDLAIADFGGVGQGIKPEQATLNEVDTIQFSGDGLSARNLQMTQQGDDVMMSFEGFDTRLLLKNMAPDQIDNIPQPEGKTVGNVLFDGQLNVTDSLDVFNSDDTRGRVFNRNTVTFLNDLGNRVAGYGGGSNDVINAQGGDDTIWGYSGSDVLRGGAGRDRLIGGALLTKNRGLEELDVLSGGEGADTFQLGDRRGAYYNDGKADTSGLNSFALITDFDADAGDVLKLAGAAEDYSLGSISEGGLSGTGIYLNSAQTPDLIAVVQGDVPVELESAAVQYL